MLDHRLRKADRWLPCNVSPVTIRAWLRSPIAWDSYDGITLEGTLQCSVIMIETGDTPDDAFAGYTGPRIDIPIPIANVELDGSSIALSSWGHPSRQSLESVRLRRRRLRVDAMGGTGKIRYNQGVFKCAQLPTPILVTPYLDFYVDGDVERLRVLLSDSLALGRARGGGLGMVAGCEILPRDGDVLVRDGRLTRTVPVGTVDGVDPISYVERESTTRAPYWHRATRKMCWVPTVEI